MSKKYSKVERSLGSFLRKFPFIRRIIKNLYQKVTYMLSRKELVNYSHFITRTITYPGSETFFGYYDKSPINESGSHIIFNSSVYQTHKKPEPNRPIQVVLRDFKTDEEISTFQTSAYNWQQGCRAQWINDREFIFNNFDNNKGDFISQIVNISDPGNIRTLMFPIYDSSSEFALSLNFNRLAILRPDYGYRNTITQGKYKMPEDKDDGVFYCDFKTNKKNLIISLRTLKGFCGITSPDAHKVNHIMLNPSNSSFVFLYRYFTKGRKYDCLVQSDLSGKSLKLLSANEIVSHYCWRTDSDIIAYMRGPDDMERYYQISTVNNEIKIFGEGLIDGYGDGHPSNYYNTIVFDTYPDKARIKRLMQYEAESKQLKELGRFYESFKYRGETRCDLHPRHLANTNKVSVDSVHEGKRQMYLIEI